MGMLRAIVHVGLAAILVIAPALCCCSVRLLAAQIVAPSSTPICPSCPQPEPITPSCCTSKKSSCCQSAEPVKNETPYQPRPAAPQQHRCDYCDIKPEATLPKSMPTIADPEPTGELLPLAVLGLTTVSRTLSAYKAVSIRPSEPVWILDSNLSLRATYCAARQLVEHHCVEY